MYEDLSPVSVSDKDERMWAMFLHLSVLLGVSVVPIAGFIAPIVIWQVKKNELPMIDEHGKVVVNWLISLFIYTTCAGLLTVFLIGIPLVFALWIIGIVFPIIGGLKANNGELWKYPLSITFLR